MTRLLRWSSSTLSWHLIVSLGALLIMMTMSLALGSVALTPARFLTALTMPDADPVAAAIVFNIRLPRVLLACCAGALTAMAALLLAPHDRGAAPDPGWSGMMPLGALGAVIALTVFPGSPWWSVMGALVGCGAGVTLYAATQRWRQRRIIGFVVALVAPVCAFGLLIGEVRVATWVRWCLGSLEQRDWQAWNTAWPVLLTGVLLVVAAEYRSSTHRWRRYVGATVATAAATVAAGALGWIGSMAARRAQASDGSPVRRIVLAGLWGALLVVGIDLAARGATALLPSPGLIGELPLGAMLVIISGAAYVHDRVRSRSHRA